MTSTSTSTSTGYQLDVHVLPGEGSDTFATVVEKGLTASPKVLPPTYFYDARGSELFEQITDLPEYYQTRTERLLLEQAAPELATLGIEDLVELGAGSARKTEVILSALLSVGRVRYVPFDVDPHTLLDSCGRLRSRFPELELHGVAGDFARHLTQIPTGEGRRLVAFLGGTIGNLEPEERTSFLDAVSALMEPSDLLLIGTDLAGEAERIEPAYDDSAGVTAEFNLNLLRRINSELGADFDLDAFDHVARYLPEKGWVEMLLRSERRQAVQIPKLDITVEFEAGEEMRTEISCKFTQDGVRSMYEESGFALREWFTDERGWYALSLAEKT